MARTRYNLPQGHLDAHAAMTEPFKRTYHARWGEMDFNGHLRNTAYLDICGDIRMLFFAEQGFSMREFERLRFGPIILRDEMVYERELKMLDHFDVTLAAAGASEDRSQFLLVNEFWRADGRRAACITSRGAWLDLRLRRIMAPPRKLREALERLPPTEDFQILASP